MPLKVLSPYKITKRLATGNSHRAAQLYLQIIISLIAGEAQCFCRSHVEKCQRGLILITNMGDV